MQASMYQKNLGLPTLLANFRPKIDDTLLKIASVKNCPRMLQFLLIFFSQKDTILWIAIKNSRQKVENDTP